MEAFPGPSPYEHPDLNESPDQNLNLAVEMRTFC